MLHWKIRHLPENKPSPRQALLVLPKPYFGSVCVGANTFRRYQVVYRFLVRVYERGQKPIFNKDSLFSNRLKITSSKFIFLIQVLHLYYIKGFSSSVVSHLRNESSKRSPFVLMRSALKETSCISYIWHWPSVFRF